MQNEKTTFTIADAKDQLADDPKRGAGIILEQFKKNTLRPIALYKELVSEYKRIQHHADDEKKIKKLLETMRDSNEEDRETLLNGFFDTLMTPDNWQLLSLDDADKMPDMEPMISVAGKRGSFLCKKEVAILSGAGSVGKSFLTLQYAIASSLANETPQLEKGVETAGMQVRKGRTLILGYEDPPKRIANRVKDLFTNHDFARLKKSNALPPSDEPWEGRLWSIVNKYVTLIKHNRDAIYGFEIGDTYGKVPAPLGAWDALWRAVKDGKYDMLVIDPVLASYISDQNSAAFVRAFMNELYKMAEKYNVAILLIAHTTKANRQDKEDITGVVSGSAAWYDASRSVAIMQPHYDETIEESTTGRKKKVVRTLKEGVYDLNSAKSNYCEPFEIVLHRCEDDEKFMGFVQDKYNRTGVTTQEESEGQTDANAETCKEEDSDSL